MVPSALLKDLFGFRAVDCSHISPWHASWQDSKLLWWASRQVLEVAAKIFRWIAIIKPNSRQQSGFETTSSVNGTYQVHFDNTFRLSVTSLSTYMYVLLIIWHPTTGLLYCRVSLNRKSDNKHTLVAKHSVGSPTVADIHLSSQILRYHPERLHCHTAIQSGSRYLVIPTCKPLFSRNNCTLFGFCRKWGCLWISRHYLPQAKSAFTSRVQRLLFIYFIKAFVPVSKYSKSENYETSLVSQMSAYHQQSGQQAIAKLCFLEKITAQKIFSDA